jgi:eukaryotic-like serine/threonine-protein kinase
MTSDGMPSPKHEKPNEMTRTIEQGAAGLDTSIGPYRLVRQLGEGGMGVVYHAQQLEPIRRDVALKIIKPGMDSKQVITRFEAERQTLAMMDHGNIARVFDAGTTASGLPYFVMELVDGIPITRYCDAKRISVRERIDLFIPVCKAIQHAHQKGIIHRDIKPSNILVTEQDGRPIPKVIDFGLAKALGRQLNDETDLMTSFGTVVGTLQYMSPEQAEINRQDVDTRSDIYSLGVVLYELMTGTTPLDREQLTKAAYVEVLRTIREEEPASPSERVRRSNKSAEIAIQRRTDPAALPKLVHGELDWITMKALEKDRGRRFETVNGLVRDLERYLSGEPVEAGPPSAKYRIMKMARKYRVALATTAAFLTLLAGAVVYSTREALRARRAEQVSEAVNRFPQEDLLAQAGSEHQADRREAPDPDLKVRTALDRAANNITGKFRGQPAVEAAIRTTLADTYVSLGLEAQARPHAERAVALRTQTAGPEARETLASMKLLGKVLYGLGKGDDSAALLTKVVSTDERRLGPDDTDTQDAMLDLARTYDILGKFAQAEQIDRKLVEKRTRLYGIEDLRTLDVRAQLANNLTRQAKYGEAIAMQNETLAVDRRFLGPEHPQTLNTMNNLAVANYYYGDYAEAERLFREVIPFWQRIMGPEHARPVTTMTNLAALQSAMGKFGDARANEEKILEIYRRTQGPEHMLTSTAMHNLAQTLMMQGDYPAAEKLLRETLRIRIATMGADNPEVLKTRDFEGLLRRGQKRLREAEAIHRSVLEAERRSPGPNHPNTFFTMGLLANVLADEKRYAEAEAEDREALEGMRRVVSPTHLRTLTTVNHLAFVLEQEGKFAEAELQLRSALAAFEKTQPDNWRRFQCQSLLGISLAGQHKPAAAEPLLQAGYQGMKERESRIPADSAAFLILAAGAVLK